MMPRHALKELLRSVKARGWSAELTRGGHVRWKHTSGAFVFGAATPSDRRAIQNLKAQMKRVEVGAAT
ncbi:hypothetical protein K2X14_11520 [Acetobacter sp. TBRC 12305]|uniref:Type II toxin-antitoxin system HicA family toxin n=1 Tax=Acetobacter garciniae TaxID=2817435 RepID=A0A939KRL6_9PROT|nr:hypothetical protein [Acetobacter garciniae]MBO1325361.1 hypothetical protein [Acetobacter garciniae]MBX0345467.1 hypothetical protein [Acetobacter garciniae]